MATIMSAHIDAASAAATDSFLIGRVYSNFFAAKPVIRQAANSAKARPVKMLPKRASVYRPVAVSMSVNSKTVRKAANAIDKIRKNTGIHFKILRLFFAFVSFI